MDVVQQIQSKSFINTVEWVRFNKTFPKNFACICEVQTKQETVGHKQNESK